MRKQRNQINTLEKIIKAFENTPKNKFKIQELVKFKYKTNPATPTIKYIDTYITDKNHPLASFLDISDGLQINLGIEERGKVIAIHETPNGFHYAVQYTDNLNNKGTLIFPEDFLLKTNEPWPQNENY